LRRIYFISPVIGLIVIYFLFFFDKAIFTPAIVVAPISSSQPSACPPLPGIEDVLVILKTGVTEALEKVPVHFQTTLKCIPNYVLFSDFEEEINGTQAHDVLRSVNETIKQTNPDFNLYNRVHEQGRSGLSPDDLSRVPNTAYGMPDNPGWKLDKWKFLPMIDEALQVRNDSKWYVFMEADTYYIWPNLLQWLAKFDPNKPYYLGNPTQIGSVIFGHGGSGFILSRDAMHRASEWRADDIPGWDRYTASEWAGDCVLGRLLLDAGAPLLWSWPMLQSNPPAEFDHLSEAFSKKPWCFPPVTYHHVTPEDIQELAKFDHGFFQNVSFIACLVKITNRRRILSYCTATSIVTSSTHISNLYKTTGITCLGRRKSPRAQPAVGNCVRANLNVSSIHSSPESVAFPKRPNGESRRLDSSLDG
jgi:hypothetical protein